MPPITEYDAEKTSSANFTSANDAASCGNGEGEVKRTTSYNSTTFSSTSKAAAYVAAQAARALHTVSSRRDPTHSASAAKNILYEEPRDEEKIARVTEQLRANLAEMIHLCRQQGVPVVLVGYIQAMEENAVLSAVASAEAVPYVETFIHLHERPADLFGEDGWHPSPSGHRHMAGKIAETEDDLWR